MDFRAYVYVALMVVLGSTTAAAAKIAVAELPVTLVPAVRFGMAGLCLLPWVLGRGVLLRMIREDALLLLVTAALCVPINQGFFLSAARLGPTSHVGIFYATCPLVVLLLAWTMRMERPDRGRLWGVLASVAGIAVIGIGNYWNGGGAATAEVRAVVLADLLLVGAVLSWGGYIAVSKPLVERHGAMPALAATFLVGCLLSLPLADLDMAGLAEICAGIIVGLARSGHPGALHHSAGLGLSKPLVAPVRREPGRDVQQRLARTDRHLGHLAVWRAADTGAGGRRGTHAGRHLLGQPGGEIRSQSRYIPLPASRAGGVCFPGAT